LNRYGKINCIFSDGQSLFCYHDLGGHNDLVWCTLEIPADHLEHFQDQELELALESAGPSQGFIAATKPLDSQGWHRFKRGELIVASKGKMLYSSHHDVPQLSSHET
jgi:predicted glutamine amidotransferase